MNRWKPFVAAKKANPSSEDEVKPLTPEEEAKIIGERALLLGTLAKFFHTPIHYFEALDDVELDLWTQTMEEYGRRQDEAVRRHQARLAQQRGNP